MTEKEPSLSPIWKSGSDLLRLVSGANQEGYLPSMGRVLRAAASGRIRQAIADEARRLIELGRLKEDRLLAPESQAAMCEIDADLEKETPDQRRLEVLRRAFLAVAIGDPSDPEGTMGLLFLKTARQMSPEGCAVLGSAYRHRAAYASMGNNADRYELWRREKSAETGIKFSGPLVRVVTELIELGLLLSQRPDRPLWHDDAEGMLTDYGLAFCRFLERSEAGTKS